MPFNNSLLESVCFQVFSTKKQSNHTEPWGIRHLQHQQDGIEWACISAKDACCPRPAQEPHSFQLRIRRRDACSKKLQACGEQDVNPLYPLFSLNLLQNRLPFPDPRRLTSALAGRRLPISASSKCEPCSDGVLGAAHIKKDAGGKGILGTFILNLNLLVDIRVASFC